MTAWRNFSQETSLTLRGRAFFVGPNASGKSNILDALRFMRDVAAMGLDDAVSLRGGMREVRSLHARQFRGVRIAVDAGPRDQSSRWSYELHFRNHPQSHRPVVERERIRLNDVPILDRPDEKDESDPERLTQTHLEQVSENQRFRPLAAFFGSIRYLHLVPQIVRERRRSGDSRDDPYGSDLLEHIADTNRRTREARLRKIQAALRVAVPHFDRFDLERDMGHVQGGWRPRIRRRHWHLNASYNHWRAHDARQNEAALQIRNAGFHARPMARSAVLHAQLLGVDQIRRCRTPPAAAARRGLNMAPQHRQAFTIGRVAGLHHHIKHQRTAPGAQVDLVSVVRLAPALADDVGVRLGPSRWPAPFGPLLLEEPELSLHDYLVSRLAGIMARISTRTPSQGPVGKC